MKKKKKKNNKYQLVSYQTTSDIVLNALVKVAYNPDLYAGIGIEGIIDDLFETIKNTVEEEYGCESEYNCGGIFKIDWIDILSMNEPWCPTELIKELCDLLKKMTYNDGVYSIYRAKIIKLQAEYLTYKI